MAWDTFSDGLSERNCGCGQGVYIKVDEFHARCGVCNSVKLTQAGINDQLKDERQELLDRMQAERDAYNREHPGEV